MKYFGLVACLLLALGAPSCQTSDFVVRREASTEFSFSSDKECKKKAADDNTGGDISKLPKPVSLNPLAYSFPKGVGNDKAEILYKVTALAPKKITYYEIDMDPMADDAINEEKLKQAVQAIQALAPLVISIIREPKRDEYETNKKYPYRATLKAKTPFPLNVGDRKSKKSIVMVEGEFGLIANPPYPP